jgi:hypothetical protein
MQFIFSVLERILESFYTYGYPEGIIAAENSDQDSMLSEGFM